MKAAFYDRLGAAAEVLQFGEWPEPSPGPGEVRVRMRWSGVNPSDVKSRAGLRSKVMPFERVVPHSDGMGVIDVVGPGVDASRVGERVWTWNAAWGRPMGTAAQSVVLPARQAVRLPEGTPDEAGACLGIPALTALHAVLMAGGVAGQRVMVAGGAGAVGHYAVQFARALGASQVIATISNAQKAEIALEAGADCVINYRDEDATQQVMAASGGHGVNRIIEVDIAANAALDVAVLRPGGDLVVYGSGRADFNLPFFPLISKNLNLRFFIVYNLTDSDRATAESVLDTLLRRGQVQHRIAQRLPLDRIAQAHHLVESGQAIGNVVVGLPD
jgi:NADPH2:quinone reductase